MPLREIAGLIQWLFESHSLWTALGLFAIAGFFFIGPRSTLDSSQPPALRETVPYISNAYRYLTDMKTFLQNAKCVEKIGFIAPKSVRC
jgi:hypothetical protein